MAGLVQRGVSLGPGHVLGPALDQFLVAQVEAVLQVEQADHQAHRQPRATGRADAAAELAVSRSTGTKRLVGDNYLGCAGRPARSKWCKSTAMKV